ncbi:hypothetical protein C6P45_003467 [Maudiozyma exigua]|uniref:PA14 domain-containing protein n=1 Tax=Maudiozyma exigua TaxID=34358 RepID=A0A9P6VUI7_MAUEX|nr:hypothetical protein C6P45_003467 [Kazachstania exigua]
MKYLSISFSFLYLINLLLGVCLAEVNPHGFNPGYSNSSNPLSRKESGQCPVTLGEPTDGLKARFYRYVYSEDTPNIDDADFLDHEYYVESRYLGEVDGVYDVNFNFFYGTQTGVISQGQINGFNLTISNFSVEYTGWFVPETSGKYTFQIGQTDDGTLLQMFGTSQHLCCENVQTENFTLYSIQYYYNTTVHTGTMEMIAGESYPFRIVFFNRDAVAIQTISFTDPNGVVHSDFSGYAKYYGDLECPLDSDPDITSSSVSGGAPSSFTGVISSSVTESLTESDTGYTTGPHNVSDTGVGSTYVTVQTTEPQSLTDTEHFTTVTASFTMTQTQMTVITVETTSLKNRTTEVTTTESITYSSETSTAVIVTTVAIPTAVTSLLTVTDVVVVDSSSITVTDIITFTPPNSDVTVVTAQPMASSKQVSVTTSIIIVAETSDEANLATSYETFETTIYSTIIVNPTSLMEESRGGNPYTSDRDNTVTEEKVTTFANDSSNENNDDGTVTTMIAGNSKTDINSGAVKPAITRGVPTVAVVGTNDNNASSNTVAVLSRRSTLAAVGRSGSSYAGVSVNNNEGNYMVKSNLFLIFLMLFAL